MSSTPDLDVAPDGEPVPDADASPPAERGAPDRSHLATASEPAAHGEHGPGPTASVADGEPTLTTDASVELDPGAVDGDPAVVPDDVVLPDPGATTVSPHPVDKPDPSGDAELTGRADDAEPDIGEASADLDVPETVEVLSQRHALVQELLFDPSRWRMWPAIAVIRWLQRQLQTDVQRIVFRSKPSLSFPASEVRDILLLGDRIDLVLSAPGLAAPGSPLPASDIARIIADTQNGGALAAWLDGPGDRFMHILESVQMETNPAYALITGGRVQSFLVAAEIVGRSVPLSAARGGELLTTGRDEPQGAVGLAGLFLGPVSATGLASIIHAFTGLPAHVEEFAGADVPTARPARVGGPFGLMLGANCNLPVAGIEVHIEGGADAAALDWVRDPVRRRSLHMLVAAYIGAPSPIARLYFWLEGGVAPPAALDDDTALGGLAVLGGSDERVKLPIGAGGPGRRDQAPAPAGLGGDERTPRGDGQQRRETAEMTAGGTAGADDTVPAAETA